MWSVKELKKREFEFVSPFQIFPDISRYFRIIRYNFGMVHVAYMKKSWGMIPKILTGEKTIESRWYQTKRAPWGEIKAGETVYFKNSGEPVTASAKVHKVIKFEGLTPNKIHEILEKYGKEDGVYSAKIPYFEKLFAAKKYCLLIFLKNPKSVKPFEVDKAGFGAMTAWITTSNVELIRQPVG